MNLLQLNLIQVELYFILIILQALTISLYLYMSELESTFIEIINSKKQQQIIIIGCLYRHPTMSPQGIQQ